MAYTKVAVSGATGNLGPAVVEQLVNAGLDVTILSQSGKTQGLPSQVKVIKVDYSSQESLVSALKGNQAYISLVPDHGSQPALIDAAIAAGVDRFIPSEFGSDISNVKTAALPVFGGKVKARQYLEKKSNEISYTYVINGLFLDWGLQVNLTVNLKGGPTTIYDNGDEKRSSTRLSDVGKAVVGILKHPEETKNRSVYIQTAAVSQNQLLDIAKKLKPGFESEKVPVSTIDLEKKSYELLQQGGDRIGEAMIGFIKISVFNKDYGAYWADKNDNELLGIKEATPEELEKIVAQYV